MIPFSDLRDGWLYRVRARNARVGVWRVVDGSFLIAREKFGSVYLSLEYHYDVDVDHGTAVALEELEREWLRGEEATEVSAVLLAYLRGWEERVARGFHT